MRAYGIGVHLGEKDLGGASHQTVGTPENDGVVVTGRHPHGGQPGNTVEEPEDFLLLVETRDVDDLDVPGCCGHVPNRALAMVPQLWGDALVTCAARRVRGVWPSASMSQ